MNLAKKNKHTFWYVYFFYKLVLITIKIFYMKKINLLVALLLSAITYSQVITYTSVRLDEGQHEAYVDLEKFWSKIHEQAINDDLETGWLIFEVIPVEGDENADNQPDFLIMNFYKDSVQMSKEVDFYKLGRSVYNKLSKKKFDKIWEDGPYGTRNFYQLERLDNTTWLFGDLEIGTILTLNAFKQIVENCEQYEMDFYKKWHNKRILNGSRKWWELNRVLSSSENGNKEITHVTLDMMGRELSDSENEEFWKEVTFMDRMMWSNGAKTREMINQVNLKLLMYKFK